MFCPGWQIDAGCFVRGGKKWHGMFCPGMLLYAREVALNVFVNKGKTIWVLKMKV